MAILATIMARIGLDSSTLRESWRDPRAVASQLPAKRPRLGGS
jgi:hypothetical protein